MTQAFPEGSMEWTADAEFPELFPPLTFLSGSDLDTASDPMTEDAVSLPDPGFMPAPGVIGPGSFGNGPGLLPHGTLPESQPPWQPLRTEQSVEPLFMPAEQSVEPVFMPAEQSGATALAPPEESGQDVEMTPEPRRRVRALRGNTRKPARLADEMSPATAGPSRPTPGARKRKNAPGHDRAASGEGGRKPRAKKAKLTAQEKAARAAERRTDADEDAQKLVAGATNAIALAKGIITWLRVATKTEATNFTVAVIGTTIYLTKVGGVTPNQATIKELERRLTTWGVQVGCTLLLCPRFVASSSAHAEMCVLASVGRSKLKSIKYLECTCTSCAYCALTLEKYGVPNSSPTDQPAKSQQGWRHPFWRVSFGTQVTDEKSQVDALRKWFDDKDNHKEYEKGTAPPDRFGERSKSAEMPTSGLTTPWLTLPVAPGDGGSGGKMETS